jgi:hypothetical protein
MDVGPQNVLGKRPSLLDPLVSELISRIEPVIHLEDVEIEGRLGTLTAVSGAEKNSSRINLPVLTEARLDTTILGHNGKPFRYEFVPDLGQETFEKIRERLELLLSGKLTAAPPNPVFKVVSAKQSHTVDEIYKKPTPCRVSYDWASYGQPGAEPRELMVKEPMDKMDVFSGQYPEVEDEEEGQNRHPWDYRFSINREKRMNASVLATLNRADCVMIREKKRVSYEMKAWTVDLTRVTVLNSKESEKFELEVELKRELLEEQLQRRAQNKAHGAHQILTDFLFFLRDLAYVFGTGVNSVSFTGGSRFPDLTACEPSEERKRKYKSVVGTEVMPIIGDYVFRILDEVRPL